MTTMSGSFAGKARLQTAVALSDSPNHELNLVEVTGLRSPPMPNGTMQRLRTGASATLLPVAVPNAATL